MNKQKLIRQRIKLILRKLIPVFDHVLAVIYSLIYLIQKSFLYKKIGPDRLSRTNDIAIQLAGLFDPKTFYRFYEKQFYDSFLLPLDAESFTKKRTKVLSSSFIETEKLKSFSNFLRTCKHSKELTSSSYAFVYTLLSQTTKRIYLSNLPLELVELTQCFREWCDKQLGDEVEIYNLELFYGNETEEMSKLHNSLLRNWGKDEISKLTSTDLFIFGIDDPIPPLGHVQEVFVRIIPIIPPDVRIGIYGLSDLGERDEWIRWNLSSWNAETLLEVLCTNATNLITEFDSREVNFLFEGNPDDTWKTQDIFSKHNVVVLRKIADW